MSPYLPAWAQGCADSPWDDEPQAECRWYKVDVLFYDWEGETCEKEVEVCIDIYEDECLELDDIERRISEQIDCGDYALYDILDYEQI